MKGGKKGKKEGRNEGREKSKKEGRNEGIKKKRRNEEWTEVKMEGTYVLEHRTGQRVLRASEYLDIPGRLVVT